MIFFVLLFALLVVCSTRRTHEGEFLSRQQTMQINGIFIFTVFLAHFSDYVALTSFVDVPIMRFRRLLGQLIVTCFLMFSGFGCAYSRMNKGMKYVHAMPIKRIASTLLKFDLAVFCFYLLNQFVLQNPISLNQFLPALIGWESIGNSNWYIFTILVMYLLWYVSCMIFPSDVKKSILVHTVLSIVYMVMIAYVKTPKVWADTLLCFSLGLWLAFYQERLVLWLHKKTHFYLLAGILCCIFILLYPKRYSLLAWSMNLESMIFSFLVVLFSYQISFHSKILLWSGEHLFELYIYQRIPMLFLQHLGLNQNIYLFFVISLLSTVLIAVFMHEINRRIDQQLGKLVRM